MGRFFSEMNTIAAARFGGCFAAYFTSLLLTFAGIALAVSVVFCADAALAVRLCPVFVCVLMCLLRVIRTASSPAPMRTSR